LQRVILVQSRGVADPRVSVIFPFLFFFFHISRFPHPSHRYGECDTVLRVAALSAHFGRDLPPLGRRGCNAPKW